ncbi:MAG TPA: porin family protein, partial [Bacteroidia bacterium]|nr:porin family protein [Bacteroidia bacterium]
MKYKNSLTQGVRASVSRLGLATRSLLVAIMVMAGMQGTAIAQSPEYSPASWWFGLAGGGNLNFYQGSTQRLTNDLVAPMAFHSGIGLGIYAAPLIEYHRATSNWGLMLQAGYDSRRGTYNQEFSPCNCPRDLAVRVGYVTAEPSLRFAPGKSDFYIFAGPRFSYNVRNKFVYKEGTNPDYPEQVAPPDQEGALSDMKPLLISAQIGAGYDIHLNARNSHTQWVLSPFAAFQPYFGQEPRTIETWNITTVRAGVALKLGRGRLLPPPDRVSLPEPVEVVTVDPKVEFTVNAPANIPAERTVREVFPLRNYVFFDLGSTQIPARYVTLRKDQVADFKEDQVEMFTPQNLSGRSNRQMIVYYNILNILGDRMVKNPNTTITLVGSSEQGPKDGLEMATSIQRYLVDVFGINESRIKVEGRSKPVKPSQSGGTRDLALLKEGDRRVTIESGSPILLMEFQTGPGAPLKPVEIVSVQEAPIESYLTFKVDGAKEAYSSWSLEVIDEQGGVQKFGPYTQEEVKIPGKSILGTRPEGDYTITMIGVKKNGDVVKKYTNAHMVLWTPPVNQEAKRFSVIFEFNESKAVAMY